MPFSRDDSCALAVVPYNADRAIVMRKIKILFISCVYLYSTVIRFCTYAKIIKFITFQSIFTPRKTAQEKRIDERSIIENIRRKYGNVIFRHMIPVIFIYKKRNI